MIYQGRITRIDDDNQVYAEIADLALDQQFPCRILKNLDVLIGDSVLIVNIYGAQEDLVIVGIILGTIDG